MLNEVVLIGRLGQEPEINQTKNGTKVVAISLPLFHTYTKEGQKTQWVRCEAWSKLGNIVEMANKGTLVTIRGELHNEAWQDEQGNWKSRVHVRIDSFRFLEKRKGTQTAEAEISSNNNSNQKEDIKEAIIYPAETLTDVDNFLGSF